MVDTQTFEMDEDQEPRPTASTVLLPHGSGVPAHSLGTSERRGKVESDGPVRVALEWREFWGWHASHPQNPRV
jgi:hypothetical protein